MWKYKRKAGPSWTCDRTEGKFGTSADNSVMLVAPTALFRRNQAANCA
jgi:hypothetical protein